MAIINTSDLTQASGVTTSTDGKYTVTGTGVFDDLMKAVNAHLSAQFSLGRLTGTDYATVYLGAIQSSLQNSVQFVLGKQQADKQADLLTKQIVTEEKKATQLSFQTVSGVQSSDADLAIKRQQVINEHFQNGMEVNEYLWEIEYVGNLGNTYTYVTIQNLTENDVVALMTADPHDAAYPVVNAVTLNQTNNLQHKGVSLSATTIAKTQEEVDLLKQKRITEHAQTLTGNTDAQTIHVDSIMGKQSSLFTQQAQGFVNDAKNAFNRNVADIIKMQINTAGDFDADMYLDVGHLLDIYPDDANVAPSSKETSDTVTTA